MPARKRRKQKNQRRFYIKTVSCLFLLSLIVYFGFSIARTRIWSGELGTIIAANLQGSVGVFIFDPLNQQQVKITIPASTEVDVSKNLGRWKLGNVYELGTNEGVGGKLLKQTLVKNLFFPVISSSGPEIDEIYKKRVGGIIPFLLSKPNQAMSFADRLRIVLFSFNRGDSQISEINLEESAYLQKTILTDGNPGYIVNKNFPKSLLPYFSITKENQTENVLIVSKTVNSYDFLRAAKIIEVLGFKVVSIEKTDTPNNIEGCIVYSTNKARGGRLAQVFDCTWEDIKNDNSQEIRVVFGENYFEDF